MAKQELLATIRDRYRASSKREKSRILDEFIAITGHHRKHGIRLLRQSSDDGKQQPAVKGRRIYDEAVREAVILVWEAADRICGKRLKAALPQLVESMERHGHLDLDPRVRQRLLAPPAPPPWTDCSSPSGHRRLAGSDEGGNSRWAAIFRCGPSPIGMGRHRDTWRLTWWSTTAAPCGAP